MQTLLQVIVFQRTLLTSSINGNPQGRPLFSPLANITFTTVQYFLKPYTTKYLFTEKSLLSVSTPKPSFNLKERFFSLDVFRGATVALMILVNNPGSWSHIFPPLKHAAWEGCTPTDLVFPFFLFAVGNAMAFVIPHLQDGGNAVFWKKLIRRTLLIFLIGLLLNWSPFIKWENDSLVLKPLENLRIMGVLQRIAICYFFASILVYYSKLRGAFLWATLLLLLYWGLCFALGKNNPYSLDGWFGTKIDLKILGASHLYHGEGVAFDPEGLVSSIPAIAHVILGYLAGIYITSKGKNYEMVAGLFVLGVALTVTGLCWHLNFPIIKKIWSSSYTVYTCGLALITISTLIYLLEFTPGRSPWWAHFFDVFGKNPLFIFVLSGFLPRVLALIRIPGELDANGKTNYLSPFSWFYEEICAKIPGDPRLGSLVYAISMIILYWGIASWMNKKKIYIKV